MTLVNTPATSTSIDDAPQASFDEFCEILAGLRLGSPSRVTIDLDRRDVEIHGARVDLRNKEYELLAHLAANADRVVSRDELFDTVWFGTALDAASRTVDAHIRRLRKKLTAAGDLITTIRGEGYRFNTLPGITVRTARAHALAA